MDKANVESIVPLLPMQQSFLWHSLNTRSGSAVIQLRCTLTGIIDTARLQSAWDSVVSEHQALRSTAHWKAVKKPLQIVHKSVSSPIAFTNQTTDAVLAHYLATDKNTLLDLSRAPAYRLAIFQDKANRCQVVWSLSHVILDGWSCARIISDWVAYYSALLEDNPISKQPSPPLNEYTRWLNNQNRDKLLHYWNSYLPDSKEQQSKKASSTQLVSIEQATTQSASAELDRAVFSEVQDSLRQSGLGLGSLLQGALALLIKHQQTQGDDEVLFSTTVSGRHIDLPDAEERIGMFANVIPVCVSFHGAATVRDWLKEIQTRFYTSLPHAHVSVSDIQACRSGQRSPFDTLLVLENQPSPGSGGKVQISDFKSGIISNMANTLVVIPGDKLHLEWQCRGKMVNKADMDRRLRSMTTLLENIPILLDKPLAVLNQYVPGPQVDLPGAKTVTEAARQKAAIDPANAEVLPIRTVERVLTDIWCEVLNQHPIDRDASFFELGGSSFQALKMFELIEQRLEVKLPATSLFDAPTVAGITALIESDKPDSWWTSVVEINRSGTKPPLFIPFEQTDMLMYRHLCRELGPDQPVYGLQIAAVSPRNEDGLAELVRRVKHLQPEGPYLLAGLSGAGLVAWDIAQQLREERSSVAMLALLDTYGPDFPQLLPPLSRLSSVARFILGQLGLVVKRGCELIVSTVRSRCKPVSMGRTKSLSTQVLPNLTYQEQVRRDYELSSQFVQEVSRGKPMATRLLNHIVLTMTKWRFRSFSAQMALIVHTQGLLLEYCREKMSTTGDCSINGKSVRQALIDGTLGIDDSRPETQRQLDRYRDMYTMLKPYNGHVLYCKASQPPPGIVDDPLAGWNDLLPGATSFHTIPGNHSSILKYPNVRVLAQALVTDMERATRIHELK